METKIGTSFQIRSSFSRGRNIFARRNADTSFAQPQSKNVDMFAISSRRSGNDVYLDTSDDMRQQLKLFSQNLKGAQAMEFKQYKLESDTSEGRTKLNFEFLGDITKSMRENFSQGLESAGVPKDVTFEFDYDINTYKAEITQISDENYTEKVETFLNRVNLGMCFTAFASRIMNGYISSAYYNPIAKNLESCYGQDIADLYLDEKGNLCGANQNLQEAIKASKRGEEFLSNPHYRFPTTNIEEIIKRLISDENITPNVSHMGYDGEQIYTNDGEFKFGKDFDPNLFGEEKYVMRGSISLFINNGYDRWLANEEKFQ